MWGAKHSPFHELDGFEEIGNVERKAGHSFITAMHERRFTKQEFVVEISAENRLKPGKEHAIVGTRRTIGFSPKGRVKLTRCREAETSAMLPKMRPGTENTQIEQNSALQVISRRTHVAVAAARCEVMWRYRAVATFRHLHEKT